MRRRNVCAATAIVAVLAGLGASLSSSTEPSEPPTRKPDRAARDAWSGAVADALRTFVHARPNGEMTVDEPLRGADWLLAVDAARLLQLAKIEVEPTFWVTLAATYSSENGLFEVNSSRAVSELLTPRIFALMAGAKNAPVISESWRQNSLALSRARLATSAASIVSSVESERTALAAVRTIAALGGKAVLPASLVTSMCAIDVRKTDWYLRAGSRSEIAELATGRPCPVRPAEQRVLSDLVAKVVRSTFDSRAATVIPSVSRRLRDDVATGQARIDDARRFKAWIQRELTRSESIPHPAAPIADWRIAGDAITALGHAPVLGRRVRHEAAVVVNWLGRYRMGSSDPDLSTALRALRVWRAVGGTLPSNFQQLALVAEPSARILHRAAFNGVVDAEDVTSILNTNGSAPPVRLAAEIAHLLERTESPCSARVDEVLERAARTRFDAGTVGEPAVLMKDASYLYRRLRRCGRAIDAWKDSLIRSAEVPLPVMSANARGRDNALQNQAIFLGAKRIVLCGIAPQSAPSPTTEFIHPMDRLEGAPQLRSRLSWPGLLTVDFLAATFLPCGAM